MTRDSDASKATERFSLRRWAQRKLDAARAESLPNAPAAPAVPAAGVPALPRAAEEPALPPIESLTIDSDFTLFMQPNVDAAVRRAALKQLFRDPRFNVMDGLDTYIDDYTKADPIPDSMLKQLAHARAIFDPPPTMLTPEGHLVDAPVAASAAAAHDGASPAAEAPALPEPDAALPSKPPEDSTQGS
ncbi:MAG TPA: DUF3306 domain-containing protein [Casimicrobiaceae bacterium]|nr:DUF3306 domain-containing protein [Casimicrobiaceae bacterium]